MGKGKHNSHPVFSHVPHPVMFSHMDRDWGGGGIKGWGVRKIQWDRECGEKGVGKGSVGRVMV